MDKNIENGMEMLQPKTLEETRDLAEKIAGEGFDLVGVTSSRSGGDANSSKATGGSYAFDPMTSSGVSDMTTLESKFENIARSTPRDVYRNGFLFAPPAGAGKSRFFRSGGYTVATPNNVGTPGLGWVPWGANNGLPVFIDEFVGLLPYTARSMEYLRNNIVGYGPRMMYRFSRYQGGTVVTKEIPYEDAGVLLRGRLVELNAQKEARGEEPSDDGIIDLMNEILPNEDRNQRKVEKPSPLNEFGDEMRQENPYKLGSLDYEIFEAEQDYKIWQRVNQEYLEFLQNNNLSNHMYACMRDYFMMDVFFPIFGLERGRMGQDWHPKIVRLDYISCATARLEQMDANRRINYVYRSDIWRQEFTSLEQYDPKLNDIVAYPALPENGSIKSLENIVRKNRKAGVRKRPTWFCMPVRLPSMNPYYRVPSWWSIFFSQVYEYASTLIADKAAARRNGTMWGKLIFINHEYLENLWADRGCDTVEKKEALRKLLKAGIDAFLKNRNNNGSTAMFETIASPDGKTLWDSVKIVDVPMNNTSVTTTNADLATISNIIYSAMGVHSMMMGNDLNDKSSTGGTVQRELDLLKTKELAPREKSYLDILQFISFRNDWDTEHSVWRTRKVSLTTLDASKTGLTETKTD